MININKKVTTKQSLLAILAVIIIIFVVSILYFIKISKDLSRGISGRVEVKTSIVRGDTAEIKYFESSTNSNIQARYPKGNRDTAVFLLSEIETFKKDVGENIDRKSTRLNSSHVVTSRMPSSA